jgi:hypothetical protein
VSRGEFPLDPAGRDHDVLPVGAVLGQSERELFEAWPPGDGL